MDGDPVGETQLGAFADTPLMLSANIGCERRAKEGEAWHGVWCFIDSGSYKIPKSEGNEC